MKVQSNQQQTVRASESENESHPESQNRNERVSATQDAFGINNDRRVHTATRVAVVRQGECQVMVSAETVFGPRLNGHRVVLLLLH